jgi:flagellar FliJ protein
MKKFTFELQTLHDIKKKEEDFEKKHMKGIEERLTKLQNGLDGLYEKMENAKLELIEQMGSSINAHRLNHYDNYMKKIKTEINRQKEKILYETMQKEECVKRLIALQKELKSLEKLHQQKHEEYLQEAKKEQEKIIDDIVSFNIAAS